MVNDFSSGQTLSDGDEALRDQRAASDVQTLQRVALGGDLSEPSIGHLRNIPQGEGPERRAAAGKRGDARVGDSARWVAPADGDGGQAAGDGRGHEASVRGLLALEGPLAGVAVVSGGPSFLPRFGPKFNG